VTGADLTANELLHKGSVNRGYLIPPTVGRWLGIAPSNKDKLSYPDLLRLYIGIQSYSNGGQGDRTNPLAFKGFVPDARSFDGATYLMKEDLTGEYRVLTMHYNNPFWTILSTYLNEPIDEMYTCLRVNHEGNVLPSLVVRQNPRSTRWMADNAEYPVTAFNDLPRWVLDPRLVHTEDVGRSNALRFNFVQFRGQDMIGTQPDINGIVNFVRAPPIVDVADICRSGIKVFDRQLSANVNEAQYNNNTSPGAKWQRIMADILMGGHLKFSGTIRCRGIQEPVCVGDNLQYEDVIYHIESITKTGSIQNNGMRDFSTTFEVTDGIPLDTDTMDTDARETLYPDLDTRDDDDAQIVENE
jgi:hypothetical protein